MRFENIVTQDTIDWLLQPDNPSVRFWALQQLQDRPFNHPEVVKAQNAIMETSCIRKIMEKQEEEGHWEKYDNMYLPKYTTTTHNLLILAELGAKRTPQIEMAMEYIFQFQRDSGHFLMDLPKTDKGRASEVKDGCCYDGNILFYLNQFGYVEDPRTQKLIEFQIDYHDDNASGWKCRAFPIDRAKVFPENCFMGRMKILKAFSRFPRERISNDLRRIIKQETETILENEIYKYLRNPNGSRKEKAGWKRFGFPLFYQSDILEVLDILTALGVKDERMQESIDYVIEVQDSHGKWLLKDTFNGKMLCEIEEKNKASKWITLRAARVLYRYLK